MIPALEAAYAATDFLPPVFPADDPSASTDAEAGLVQETQPAPIVEGEYCWSYSSYISRTVVIDGNLFSISDAGVAVHELDGLAEVTWLPFS